MEIRSEFGSKAASPPLLLVNPRHEKKSGFPDKASHLPSKVNQRVDAGSAQPARVETADFRLLPVSQPHLSAGSDTHEEAP